MNRDQYESKLNDYNCEHGYQAVARAPRTEPAHVASLGDTLSVHSYMNLGGILNSAEAVKPSV